MNIRRETKLENEALIPLNHHSVCLPIFEGPLDLLLFLIRKNEIDIYDIPIEAVTQQYLGILDTLDEMDLELTGEFFVMASMLMLIKSRRLLPKQERPQETEEDALEEDPRWELVQQLLEYKRVKEETQELEHLIAKQQDFLPRCCYSKEEAQERPLRQSDKMELWNAFNQVLHRLAERVHVGEIHEEEITVADRMTFILKSLREKSEFYLMELFKGRVSLNVIVATFLALLELSRLKQVLLTQSEAFGDILCSSKKS